MWNNSFLFFFVETPFFFDKRNRYIDTYDKHAFFLFCLSRLFFYFSF